MSEPKCTADRNLLFGVLALQMGFIGRDDLTGALQDWAQDRDRPIGDLLVQRSALSARRRAVLDELVQEHLDRHGRDPVRSLAAVCSQQLTSHDLEQLAAPALGRGHVATLLTAPATIASTGSDGALVVQPAQTVGPLTSGGERFRLLRL